MTRREIPAVARPTVGWLGFAGVLALVAGVLLGEGTPRSAGAESMAPRLETALDMPVAGLRGISGVVRIAPGLVDRIGSTDTLYVYAHALDGDPAPLVVLRKRANELPVAFFLDDSTAVNPARLPSRHNELVIGARVARRGAGATPARGDLQGFSAPVRYGQAGVVIVIDSEVK